jgi:hypothetical protein
MPVELFRISISLTHFSSTSDLIKEALFILGIDRYEIRQNTAGAQQQPNQEHNDLVEWIHVFLKRNESKQSVNQLIHLNQWQ